MKACCLIASGRQEGCTNTVVDVGCSHLPFKANVTDSLRFSVIVLEKPFIPTASNFRELHVCTVPNVNLVARRGKMKISIRRISRRQRERV